MANIIVTTPKSEMAASAQEAEDCRKAGGGFYFRRFARRPNIEPGDRVYWVEDGYVRGFAVVFNIEHRGDDQMCETTGRAWEPGFYVYMSADSWKWIRPFPMKGFQGYRYVHLEYQKGRWWSTIVVGNWLDPKPETAKGVDR